MLVCILVVNWVASSADWSVLRMGKWLVEMKAASSNLLSVAGSVELMVAQMADSMVGSWAD